ncbi:PPE family protein, SVP subgroup [Mycobacterium noviomagense]|uniref:PE family protein n=1 Tax=Mycobacterium noviomagense TaxID=459858 RepID=A0A7I7P9V9_9MYCO|nr:PE domain-containing protein [Mycobacterium noviomagense]ORB11157.1 PE family protein [Mycobacterium noviomagense]BBY05345.1 PE family protein [Mycobacterium noviomagense]
MSFVTTLPIALEAAAGKLEALGSALAAQNAAAAAPTTGVVPAAADEVSALQATQFSAYGTWYQQVSAQATAVHQTFVNTLAASAGSYSTTEAANQAATSAAADPPSVLSLLSPIIGTPAYTDGGLLSNNPASLLNINSGNWGAAASDLWALSGGGLLPSNNGPTAVPAEGAATAAVAGAAQPTAQAAPAVPTGGGAPVMAGVGQASSVGRLSVPPSWAGEAGAVSSPAPARLAGMGWTAAAPESTPVATVPAGMPSVATAGKAAGLGAPRYGVKPTVMPKPEVV